jgi:hypothetical protein
LAIAHFSEGGDGATGLRHPTKVRTKNYISHPTGEIE